MPLLPDPGKRKLFRIDWRRIRNSVQFHNAVMFMVCLVTAVAFWFIMALNDNVTRTFSVKIKLTGVPDSVTFITVPPADLHVTLRDKGTNILRSGIVKNPEIGIAFGDYARDGRLRLTHSDISSLLRVSLGSGIQIASVSLDSLSLPYTTQPGKRVPVDIVASLSPASGYVIQGKPKSLEGGVLVYSTGNESDTIRKAVTRRLAKRDLSKNSVFKVSLEQIPNVRFIPSAVQVEVRVEPLVHKEAYANIEAVNVPEGTSLLLFPNRVPVSFFVPMSRFNDPDVPILVEVDYNETSTTPSSRLPLRIRAHSPKLLNVSLQADSVEYTVVRH